MSSPKILAVTFDMDGLMFNTEDLYDQVGQTLLERRGFDFTREIKLKMMGLPGSVAFEIMRNEFGIPDSAIQLQLETDEIFLELLPAQIETMPGLERLLETLERFGIPKAVATSAHREFARTALGQFDLERRFEFVLTADDVENGKPHPDIYLASAEKLGVKTSQMLVLEDSLIGSTAGAAAGAFTVAVPTSHSRHQNFSHTAYVANSLDDPFILQLFGSQ